MSTAKNWALIWMVLRMASHNRLISVGKSSNDINLFTKKSLGKKYKVWALLIFNNTVTTKDEIIYTIWPDQDVTNTALKILLNELRNEHEIT
jgi:hypothetical protein